MIRPIRQHFALILASVCLSLACHRVTTISAEHPAALIAPRGLWYWDSFKADTVRLLVGDSASIDVFWTRATTDLLNAEQPPGKPVSPKWSSENSSVAHVRAQADSERCRELPNGGIQCIGWEPSWRAMVVGRRPGETRIRVRVRDTTLVRPVRVTAR